MQFGYLDLQEALLRYSEIVVNKGEIVKSQLQPKPQRKRRRGKNLTHNRASPPSGSQRPRDGTHNRASPLDKKKPAVWRNIRVRIIFKLIKCLSQIATVGNLLFKAYEYRDWIYQIVEFITSKF